MDESGQKSLFVALIVSEIILFRLNSQIEEKSNFLEADLGNLKAGIYVLQIADTEKSIYSEKIIKN